MMIYNFKNNQQIKKQIDNISLVCCKKLKETHPFLDFYEINDLNFIRNTTKDNKS